MEQTFTMTLSKKQAEWVIQQAATEQHINDLESDKQSNERRLSRLQEAFVVIADIVNYKHNEQPLDSEGKYGQFVYSKDTDEGHEVGYINLDGLIEMITNCSKTPPLT